MVMPSIPSVLRASLTASSLNGWIIASIFFMGDLRCCKSALRLQIVALFPMHAEVQAVLFLLRTWPQAAHRGGDLETHEAARGAQCKRDQHAHRLVAELP